MGKKDNEATTDAPVSAEEARARLKEINAERQKQNDEARALQEQLDEGKEARKAQRSAGALLKKLFKDRRAVVLRALPVAQAAAGANGSVEELSTVMEELEAASDDMLEILGHQKAIMENEEHVPDLSGLELPDEPRKARTRTPAAAAAPADTGGKSGKKGKKGKKAAKK